MEFYDDFSEEFEDFYVDENTLLSRIDISNKYLDEGQAVLQTEFIEDTIQLCLEYEKLDEGLNLADRMSEIMPFTSEYWQLKGTILNNKFDFMNAYLAFDKSLSLNPTDVDSLIGKSIAEESLDLFDDAVITLKKVIEVDEYNEEAYYNLGTLYEREDKYEIAIEHLSMAVSLDEGYLEAWYELGYCYEILNRFDKALQAYDKYLEIDPFSYSGWYNKGIAYIKKGEFNEAVRDFELSIAINENFSSSWFNCGVSYANLNNLEKALECITKAVELDDKDDALWFTLGQTYEDLNRFEDAINSYTTAISLSLDHFDALLARAICYNTSGQKLLALKDIKNAEKIDPSSIEVLDLSVSINKSIGNLESAIKSCKKITRLDKNNFTAWNRLAELYSETGNWVESINSFNMCIKLKPEKATAFYEKVKRKFLRNKNTEALEYLKSSFSVYPKARNESLKGQSDIQSSNLTK